MPQVLAAFPPQMIAAFPPLIEFDAAKISLNPDTCKKIANNLTKFG